MNKTNLDKTEAFLVKDDRVLKGPLGRSLCSFVRSYRSLRLIAHALLARSIQRLDHFLRSLPRRKVKFIDTHVTIQYLGRKMSFLHFFLHPMFRTHILKFERQNREHMSFAVFHNGPL